MTCCILVALRVLRWMRWLPAGFYLMIGFPVLALLVTAVLTSIFWIFTGERGMMVTSVLQLVWLITVIALLAGMGTAMDVLVVAAAAFVAVAFKLFRQWTKGPYPQPEFSLR